MLVSHRVQARVRDLLDFQEIGGPVIRTHPWLERLFPRVVWRYPSRSSESPIHLTFDDGPSANGTSQILEVLDRHGVHASFFMTGSNLYQNEDVIAQIRAGGHSIGYHGLTHDSWWMRASVRRDLEMNPARIPLFDDNPFIDSDKQLLLRAPFGRIDFASMHSADKLNGRLVHWSLAIRDWMANLSSKTLAQILYRFVMPGDIVLLHDNGPSVNELAAALDRVIPHWMDAGMLITDIEPFLATD